MTTPTMDGITAETIVTPRISTRVLFSGPEDGIPVLFLHGNTSSATWWEETMLALPDGYRGIAPDQRGFGEADPDQHIDATRGMADLADDAFALLDHLDIDKTHVVGNSLGGVVVWKMMMDQPERLLTVTQIAPGSPYGFGGTKGLDGEPIYDDYAGSGGGLSNPQLIEFIKQGDRTTDSPFTLRSVLRVLVYKPPFIPEREEDLLTSALSTHIGEQDVPGDAVPSPNWPGMAPGKWGPANALSPKYLDDPQKLIDIDPKPPVLWVRGSNDLAVSDTAASDPGALGMQGLLPGWPGAEVYPPQPMLGQTRAVLEAYQVAGGGYNEVVIEDSGHAPFIEKPDEFNAVFHQHLT